MGGNCQSYSAYSLKNGNSSAIKLELLQKMIQLLRYGIKAKIASYNEKVGEGGN